MFLRIGTRGSKLSLVQTDLVIEKLRQQNPELSVEKKIIMTSGDRDQKTPLFRLDRKGIFEKEVNRTVLDGDVDLAVHSLKDLTVDAQDTNLVIAGVPERASPADVLVSMGNRTLEELEPESVVGTSSLLRLAQLRRVRPDLKIEPIRGNVESRIMKVEKGEYDAAILAEAGVARLGLASKIAQRLPIDEFIPAPGQGIIAPVTKRSAGHVLGLLEKIEYVPARAEGEAERELVSVLEGGCKVPIGALASASGKRIMLTGYVLSMDGEERLEAKGSAEMKDAVSLGRAVGEDLLKQGAKRLEQGWRSFYR